MTMSLSRNVFEILSVK